ncbi:MAG: hypothetical protein IJ690_03565 [Clostridia bacterium]|nr:hypothetical protein [Clostridia bacterium]
MKNNSNVNEVKKSEKKVPLKNKKMTIILIVAVAFLTYCIFLFIKLLSNPTDTFIVEQGKIYKEESVSGYLIRDEEVIENESANRQNSSIKS